MDSEASEQRPPGIPSLEDHVEEYLAFRVLRKALQLLSVLVALVAAITAFFGYNLKVDIEETTLELVETQTMFMDSVVARAAAKVDSLDIIRVELQTLVARQERAIAAQARDAETHQDLTRRQTLDLQRLRSQIESESREVESSIDTLTRVAEEVRGQSLSLRQDLANINLGLSDIRAATATMDTSLAMVGNRVFGSWAFVVHEKSESELAAIGLTVRMSTIRDGRLRDFEVLAGGENVLERHDLAVGNTRCTRPTRDHPFRYRITPSYIVELFMGRDIAGLQVESLLGDDSCQRRVGPPLAAAR